MYELPGFGAWLQRRRKALDLTQVELAQQVGCSVVSIRKFERDEQRPSKQMAERLAERLALPQEYHAAFVAFARMNGQVPCAPVDYLPNNWALVVAEASSGELQSIRNIPQGTVTFLFTDIEGSTELWAQHREAMRSVLGRHHAIVQRAIASQNGMIFKTVGDAICAAFDKAPMRSLRHSRRSAP